MAWHISRRQHKRALNALSHFLWAAEIPYSISTLIFPSLPFGVNIGSPVKILLYCMRAENPARIRRYCLRESQLSMTLACSLASPQVGTVVCQGDVTFPFHPPETESLESTQRRESRRLSPKGGKDPWSSFLRGNESWRNWVSYHHNHFIHK